MSFTNENWDSLLLGTVRGNSCIYRYANQTRPEDKTQLNIAQTQHSVRLTSWVFNHLIIPSCVFSRSVTKYDHILPGTHVTLHSFYGWQLFICMWWFLCSFHPSVVRYTQARSLQQSAQRFKFPQRQVRQSLYNQPTLLQFVFFPDLLLKVHRRGASLIQAKKGVVLITRGIAVLYNYRQRGGG